MHVVRCLAQHVNNNCQLRLVCVLSRLFKSASYKPDGKYISLYTHSEGHTKVHSDYTLVPVSRVWDVIAWA